MPLVTLFGVLERPERNHKGVQQPPLVRRGLNRWKIVNGWLTLAFSLLEGKRRQTKNVINLLLLNSPRYSSNSWVTWLHKKLTESKIGTSGIIPKMSLKVETYLQGKINDCSFHDRVVVKEKLDNSSFIEWI